ncbi:MAG TPA: TonB-dependent receptor plug domain-containing protein [Flavobacterium sp.]|nr:TonB-dependent receptor plug domain-containing protein [Flavobacterium sp.]
MMQPKIAYVLIVWLFSAMAFSQEKLPIRTVLEAIEKQHHIRFNYTEETLSAYTITVPEKSLSLTEKLQGIQNEIPLEFAIINNDYVVITASKEAATGETNSMSFQLNEVSIDNYLASGISKKKNGNIEIRPEKFGILPGLTEPDVLQTMQQIPGVYSADESISNINVRGGTHDQNLFLWNGIRMFQTGHFFGLISAFNPSLAHTITISKNGSPAFFGESVSSVVDISTHSENIAQTSVGIGVNLISADFFAKMKLSQKASFTVSGRRSFTDAANTPTYQKYYNRIFQNTIVMKVDDNQIVDYNTDEDFYFYDFTAQYRQKIGKKHELILDGIGISNQLGISQNAVIDNIFQSKYSSLEQQSFGANLSWKTDWNPFNYTKINGYVSYYNLDATNEAIQNNQVLQQQNTVLDTGLRIENHYQVNPLLAFNYGYQYNEIGITNDDAINSPDFQRHITEVMRSHAVVLETEYVSKNKDAYLKAGIRTNYYEELEKFVVEPRLQFNYSLSETLKVEILGEQKSQSASQIIDLQRDFLGIEKRRWTLASENIPLQKSQQFSIGLSFKNKQWLVTLDNFFKKVSGISSPGQAFQNQLELIKINGNYTVLGSEILIQRNFHYFYSWLGYSYNRNEYRFDYYNPDQFPNNFEIQHSISWAAVYEQRQLKIALGSKWNSGRPTTTPLSLSDQVIAYNNPNDNRLKDYLQFNISASYFWNLGVKTKLTANASVLNILNKKNIINRYYRVNTVANDIESVNTYSMERTPNLSLRLTF